MYLGPRFVLIVTSLLMLTTFNVKSGRVPRTPASNSFSQLCHLNDNLNKQSNNSSVSLNNLLDANHLTFSAKEIDFRLCPIIPKEDELAIQDQDVLAADSKQRLGHFVRADPYEAVLESECFVMKPELIFDIASGNRSCPIDSKSDALALDIRDELRYPNGALKEIPKLQSNDASQLPQEFVTENEASHVSQTEETVKLAYRNGDLLDNKESHKFFDAPIVKRWAERDRIDKAVIDDHPEVVAEKIRGYTRIWTRATFSQERISMIPDVPVTMTMRSTYGTTSTSSGITLTSSGSTLTSSNDTSTTRADISSNTTGGTEITKGSTVRNLNGSDGTFVTEVTMRASSPCSAGTGGTHIVTNYTVIIKGHPESNESLCSKRTVKPATLEGVETTSTSTGNSSCTTSSRKLSMATNGSTKFSTVRFYTKGGPRFPKAANSESNETTTSTSSTTTTAQSNSSTSTTTTRRTLTTRTINTIPTKKSDATPLIGISKSFSYFVLMSSVVQYVILARV